MQNLLLLMQIGDLFQGKFTWSGFILLFLFLLMGFTILAFALIIGYKAFRSKSGK